MPESKMTNQEIGKVSSSTFPNVTSFLLFTIFVFPVAAAFLLYRFDSFDAAALPLHELNERVATAPAPNDHVLASSADFVGRGVLIGPEDVAYEPESGLIYTGCLDGWIKRIRINDSDVDSSVVENWVNTGGRPLGLAHAGNHHVIVADADKGLLSISKDGVVKLLTDEAEGLKFKLTDGVDIATDGMIYFTDASYKYRFKEFIYDVLEGKPHGRLMSYNPTTEETKVLLRDLYFANGVVLSPDQTSLIFCETVMRRCRKYYLQGDRKGIVENFVVSMIGTPDNIKYDGEGRYWIGLSTEIGPSWDLALKYPLIRKIMAIMARYVGLPQMEKNAGVFVVDLEGKPVAHYYDPGLKLITCGIKIGNHLYLGSIVYPYLIRINLEEHPAQPAS